MEEPTQEHPETRALAQSRTDLAAKRTIAAGDRTLMAWVRTSISMISFGFTIFQFFDYLSEDVGTARRLLLTPRDLALVLIVVGTAQLVIAIIQYRQFIADVGIPNAPRWTLAVLVAILVVVLGVFAFIAVLAA